MVIERQREVCAYDGYESDLTPFEQEILESYPQFVKRVSKKQCSRSFSTDSGISDLGSSGDIRGESRSGSPTKEISHSLPSLEENGEEVDGMRTVATETDEPLDLRKKGQESENGQSRLGIQESEEVKEEPPKKKVLKKESTAAQTDDYLYSFSSEPSVVEESGVVSFEEEVREETPDNFYLSSLEEKKEVREVKRESLLPLLVSRIVLSNRETKLQHQGSLKTLQVPVLAIKTPNMMDIGLYLARVQDYFNQLGYHRVGEPKIRVNTQVSIKQHMDTARNLIKSGEPIKCLHALVMAIQFTNCTLQVERFPLNFRSEFNGKEYKHVVLGMFLYGHYGALGISRDPQLQDKAPLYPRLSDLINEFARSYASSGHKLLEVKIGGVITHDPHSLETISWRQAVIDVSKLTQGEIDLNVEKCSKQLRAKMGSACLKQIRPSKMVFPTDPSGGHLTSLPPISTRRQLSKENESHARTSLSQTRPAQKTNKAKGNKKVKAKSSLYA